MAFTNQTCTGAADFFAKLNTFLSGEGWSTHHVPASGEFAAWKNPSGNTWITLAAQWDTATPRFVGIYQWHGAAYNSGTSPWLQMNDSGNGAASTSGGTLDDQRRVDLGTGGPAEFWCFEDDDYFRVIIRRDVDVYEHFGAGLIEKFNDWDGGEYCYGHIQYPSSTNDYAIRGGTSILLDGLALSESPVTNMQERCATMHIEGMDNQAGSSMWAVCMGNQASGSLGTDRAGNDRIHVIGGFRGGPFPPLYGQFAGTIQRGNVPMYAIVPTHWNRTTDNIAFLGRMRDVRGIGIRNFTAGQEITVAGDTWVVFPSFLVTTATGPAFGSGYQGIAYKQVA